MTPATRKDTRALDRGFTPSRRRYVYRVAMAALPLLILAGMITDAWVPAIAAVLGAVLVPGLADKNVNDDD